tara:strand:+ start:23 stop:370 length:348 start_codon:yes stop_codon:yes gene_type:complete
MENHKSPWTKKEEDELLHRLRLEEPISTISKKHQRTERAIEMRIAMIFKKLIEKGSKISTLSKDFHLSENEIRNYIEETSSTEPKSNFFSFPQIKEQLDRMEEKIDKIYRKLKMK